MTWEIITGVITLAGALVGAAKIISNNTRALTEIRCTVEALHTSFEEQRDDIREIHENLTALGSRIQSLEHDSRTQLCLRENKGGNHETN